MKLLQIIKLEKGDLIYCPLTNQELEVLSNDRQKHLFVLKDLKQKDYLVLKRNISFFYACFKGSKSSYESDL